MRVASLSMSSPLECAFISEEVVGMTVAVLWACRGAAAADATGVPEGADDGVCARLVATDFGRELGELGGTGASVVGMEGKNLLWE